MKIYYLYFWIVFLFSCATVKSPSGGPDDKTGPQLLSSSPEPNATRFTGKTLRFQFDEFLATADYSKEVFISPPPEQTPEIFVIGKSLFIRFRQDLQPNTTYVVTIASGIKDANAQNPLTKPFQFAFSTGAKLDTLSISGQVTNSSNSLPESGMLVLLYDADSIQNNEFLNKKPRYAALTDSGGYFRLQNLKPGSYRMLGVKDQNQDYRYSLLSERIAVPVDLQNYQFVDKTINVSDSSSLDANYTLLAFTEDHQPPVLTKYEWLTNQAIQLTFSEPVISLLVDSVRYQSRIFEDPKQLTIPVSVKTSLLLTAIQDTAGNLTDTLLAISKPLKPLADKFDCKQIDEKKWISPYSKFMSQRTFVFQTNHVFSQEQLNMIQLIDSTGKQFTPILEFEPWRLIVTMPSRLDTSKGYQLLIPKEAVLPLSLDSNFSVSFTKEQLNLENFSSIAGKVETDWKSVVLFITHLELKQTWKIIGKEFQLKNIPPGEYKVQVLEDRDRNFIWTTGNYAKRTLPERTIILPDVIKVRPGWEIEDLMLKSVSTKKPD
ncbi:MAG: Ig-like domain-containing protein [Bacteroidia bacterium]|nr:Ig-like domain-containing protein [Bacteroidia bacterium]